MAEKEKVIKKTLTKKTKAVLKTTKAATKRTKPTTRVTKTAAKSTKSAAKSTTTASKSAKSAPENRKSVERPVGKAKVRKVMKEFKKDELHSGSKKGPKVKSREQAIAIALSEGRKAESGKLKAIRKVMGQIKKSK